MTEQEKELKSLSFIEGGRIEVFHHAKGMSVTQVLMDDIYISDASLPVLAGEIAKRLAIHEKYRETLQVGKGSQTTRLP